VDSGDGFVTTTAMEVGTTADLETGTASTTRPPAAASETADSTMG